MTQSAIYLAGACQAGVVRHEAVRRCEGSNEGRGAKLYFSDRGTSRFSGFVSEGSNEGIGAKQYSSDRGKVMVNE
jgi:hypothetical protein